MQHGCCHVPGFLLLLVMRPVGSVYVRFDVGLKVQWLVHCCSLCTPAVACRCEDLSIQPLRLALHAHTVVVSPLLLLLATAVPA